MFVVKTEEITKEEVPANNQDNTIGRGIILLEEVKLDA